MSDPIIDQMLAEQRQQQPASQDASNDPIIAAMRQDQQAQTSRAALAVAGASSVNPDRAAENQQLATRFKVPPNVVDKFPDAFRQRALTENAATALQQAPVLRDALAQNPQLAQVAHDDIPVLQKIENTLMELPKAMGQGTDEAALGVNRILSVFPRAYDWLAGGTKASDWWTNRMIAPAVAATQDSSVALDPNANFAGKLLHSAGGALQTLSLAYLTGGGGAAAEGAATAPTLTGQVAGMISHGTRMMAAPSLIAATNTGSDVYAATGSNAAALQAAGAAYGTTTLGGIVPFSAPGKVGVRLLAGAGSGLVTSEVSRQLMNAALPNSMQQPEPSTEDRALDAISGMVFGGLAGPHDAADLTRRSFRAARESYVQDAKAQEATSAAQTIAKLSELAAQSKLRERDPDSFKQLVADVADDAQVDHLYVGGRQFAEALDKSGISADELIDKVPGLATQMREALQTEGMVRIPLEDYATHIAGTALDQAIQPELRTSPDSMTFGEAQRFYQDQAKTFQEQATQVVGEKAQDDAFMASGQKVEDYVREQLENAGRFPGAVNDAYAQLWRAFFDTTAARAGVLPHELLERHGLEVRADALPGEATRMDQEARGQIALSEGGPAAISLFKAADLSTFLHESGHYFLEVHSDLAKRMGADSPVGRDFQKALDWMGVGKDAEGWRQLTADEKREAHEKFARGFETYLMEGKAPNLALQSIFGRFRSWLVNVYKSVAGLRAELTPDMRGVFDRMLASQEAIEQAEKARGMLPMAREAFPDEATWARYLDEQRQATNDAIADLQSKSIRDMQWISNLKDKALKKLQREAKAARAAIKDQVTWQVNETPARQAEAYLAREGGIDSTDREALKAWEAKRAAAEKDVSEHVKAAKLANAPNLKGIEKGQYLAKAKREMDVETAAHMLDWERENPRPTPTRDLSAERDVIGEMFGFTSGKEMMAAIKAAGPAKDEIERMTDQRMLQEHGELTDPNAIDRAAEAAIHNDVRARVLSRELNALAKATGSARMLAKAAKEAAEASIARKKVSEIAPSQYTAAETRAAKAADAALRAGDTQAAVIQKRAQLLNNRLVSAALDAQRDVEKGLTYLKRFTKDSVRKKVDVDIREQIDALLEKVDLRKNPPDEPPREIRNLRDWRDSQVAAGLIPAIDDRLLDPAFRQHYQDMTVEQFRGLVDAVRSMEHIGRERNTITLEGERTNLDDVVRNMLIPKLEEVGERFSVEERYSRPEDRDLGALQLTLAKLGSWMRSTHAMLLRPDYKANVLDRHQIDGPFARTVFDPLMQASYRKAEMLKALSDDFATKARELGAEWQKSLTDNVTNTTLLDPIATQERGQAVPMKINRGRMLMIALHSGNESNFAKLTQGYGWRPEDVWSFLAKNMTAKDIDAVNHVWKLYHSKWPEMEAMYRRLGQTVPPKIEARPADLPAGRLDGGYAHIDYDPLKSRRGQRAGQNEAKEIADKGVSVKDYFRRTGTTNGAMNARLEGYTDMIDLDFHGIEQALQETIHDLAYREALVDVNKVLEHPELKSAYLKAYGRESYDALHTWMGRIANSGNADHDVKALTKVLAYARTGMVMNAIALRASTVVKHGGAAAFKTMGYFAGGGEGYYAARQAAMFHDYKAQMAEAIERSPEIRQRLLQQDRDYRSTAHHLFEQEGWIPKAERFGHAAVAFADAFSAVATHNAAYDWAISKGIPERLGGTGEPMSHDAAVRFADKMVREAHGSTSEAAMSNIMAARGEGVKLFTTLYGFMNNTYGQMADYASKLRTAGIGKPEILARSFAAILVPALAAGWVEEEPNAENWAGWIARSIAGEVAGTVPLVRDAAAMLKGLPSAGQVPVESWLHALVAPVQDAIKIHEGKHAPIIQDAANAAGEGLHIPGLGQLGKTAQYEADVAAGRKEQDLKKAIVGGH